MKVDIIHHQGEVLVAVLLEPVVLELVGQLDVHVSEALAESEQVRRRSSRAAWSVEVINAMCFEVHAELDRGSCVHAEGVADCQAFEDLDEGVHLIFESLTVLMLTKPLFDCLLWEVIVPVTHRDTA